MFVARGVVLLDRLVAGLRFDARLLRIVDTAGKVAVGVGGYGWSEQSSQHPKLLPCRRGREPSAPPGEQDACRPACRLLEARGPPLLDGEDGSQTERCQDQADDD